MKGPLLSPGGARTRLSPLRPQKRPLSGHPRMYQMCLQRKSPFWRRLLTKNICTHSYSIFPTSQARAFGGPQRPKNGQPKIRPYARWLIRCHARSLK